MENAILNHDINYLKQWILQDQRNIINAEPFYFDNMGYGLKAISQCKKSDIILGIHKDYFISIDSAYDDKYMQDTIFKKTSKMTKRQIMAVYLWYQLGLDKDSKWFFYLKTLPKSHNNPHAWSDNHINSLIRSDYIDKFMDKKRLLIEEFGQIEQILYDKCDNDKIKKMNLKDYLWLVSIIESRSVSFPAKYDPNLEVGALIPYFDFANHTFDYKDETNENPKLTQDQSDKESIDTTMNSSTKSIAHDISILKKPSIPNKTVVTYMDYFYYDKRKELFILKAFQDYKQNDQIFIIYSTKPNLHFVEYYGFIPEKNPYNLIEFILPTDEHSFSNILGYCDKIDNEKRISLLVLLVPTLINHQNLQKFGTFSLKSNQNNKKKTHSNNNGTIHLSYILIQEIKFSLNEEGEFDWLFDIFIKILCIPEKELEKLEKNDFFSLFDEKYYLSKEHEENAMILYKNLLKWIMSSYKKTIDIETNFVNGSCIQRQLSDNFINNEMRIIASIKY